jgi:hypothetical protein
MAKLTLDDIADLREYEREREEFRRHIIDLKKRRRIGVGPIVTLVFENRDTIRFQIQEMARVEKLISDAAIETELRIYNPLIPDPGSLCTTMFIELTDDVEMREWLPKLVGIETCIEIRLANGDVVSCVVDPDHAQQLTREDTTAAVHYVHFTFTPDQITELSQGGARLAVAHANYQHEAELTDASVSELLADLRG